MRSPLIAASIALALFAGAAQAQTLKATSNMLLNATNRTPDFTSDTTPPTPAMQLVIAARDDAASFVASNGAIRGAQLEAAFSAVRAQYPAARNVSDQELATAILAP